jgi:hypothetical protein
MGGLGGGSGNSGDIDRKRRRRRDSPLAMGLAAFDLLFDLSQDLRA